MVKQNKSTYVIAWLIIIGIVLFIEMVCIFVLYLISPINLKLALSVGLIAFIMFCIGFGYKLKNDFKKGV